ncbi:MAG: ATP-binding protein [Campylobacterota bacterium]|nr:ATP-binding protein [Campylobacterota bacterium]
MNKNKIIFTIVFSIFVILSISTYYNGIKQKEYIETKHKQSFEIMQQMIDGKIIFFRKQLSARIRNIIYNNAKFKDAILSNDRDKLKSMMNTMFRILKKENKYTKTLHLISKNNISIYRAHKPKKYGDDLTSIRPIVKYVNKHKRAKYGFEVGVYAMTYRLDIPIVYGSDYYGLLEYSIDPKLFIDDLTSVSNYIESAVLVNKNILDDDNNFFKNLTLDNILKNNHFEHNNEHYTSFIYNLLAYDGQINCKIIIATNTTADTNIYYNMIKLSIFNQLILILIISLIVIYAFSYYEKKIKKLIEHEKQHERISHQQSKMASMGEMIGNIAHQWRQPLSVVSTVASGITAQKEFGIYDDKTLVKSMDTIVEQTAYMSKTIDDFRDFFKSNKEKVRFEINKVVNQNITLIHSSLKSHDINLEFKPDVEIMLTGLQNELTQAILNILNNAKDQLIKLDKADKKFIKIEVNHDDKNLFIDIIDNGGGVPKNIKANIFEPYFTTKHKSQGTGIGLYMTHEIITKHFNGKLTVENRDIEIENTLYSCAVFKITLPIV